MNVYIVDAVNAFSVGAYLQTTQSLNLSNGNFGEWKCRLNDRRSAVWWQADDGALCEIVIGLSIDSSI